MKRALITGITGMVGSHLVDYLFENTDWEIHGMVRWNDDMKNICHLSEHINNKNRIYLHNGDLNDFASLVSVVNNSKPDYIFHLAAQSYPKTSFDSPLETLKTNIIGTCSILEVIRLSSYNPIIHICASSEVFGRVSKDELPIHEDVRFHPASPYAISKVGTDLIGRFYAEAYDMCVMTTRMFTHTGPRRGDVFAESTFAKQIAMAEAGIIEPVIKVGNLNSMRTWADVRDAVKAYYMLVTVDPTPGAYYNIGGSYSCTIGEMLDYLISKSTCENLRVETESQRLRPIDADLQIPDTSKFTRHTGWKPEIEFETTMNDLLDYWRTKVKLGKHFLTR
jgi:GDP-mannose 4,6-dehydratase|tara:strand:+ start:7517 stop:8524 length:1008 start_codon:yes stop_codon:yes gene_type:complete